MHTPARSVLPLSFLVVASCSGTGSGSGDNPDAGDQAVDGGGLRSDATITAPRCNDPDDRVLWSLTSPGPDSVYAATHVNDADGDGVADILMATDTLNLGLGTPSPTGNHLVMISGASEGIGQVVWSASPKTGRAGNIQDPDNGSGCMLDEGCLDRIGDINGDSVDDIAFGAAGNTDAVFALDGASGETIWFFDTHPDASAEPPTGDVNMVRRVGDVTGDGIPEVAAGTSANTFHGYLFDGSDGQMLWRFSRDDNPMLGVVSLGDSNGDGFDEVVFGTGIASGGESEYRIHAVSGNVTEDGQVVYGKQGQALWSKATGDSNWWMTRLSDVDGDGVDDIAAAVWDRDLHLLSGKTGQFIWSAPEALDILTNYIANVGDLNGDGVEDIGAASLLDGMFAFSGSDGELLWRGQAPDGTFGLAGVGDLNGDGKSEVVAGGKDGVVRYYEGSGELLWSFETGDQRVFVVQSVPDLSGDGRADVIAGTRYRSGEGVGGGTLWALKTCANVVD